jgi:hypothetical protein
MKNREYEAGAGQSELRRSDQELAGIHVKTVSWLTESVRNAVVLIGPPDLSANCSNLDQTLRVGSGVNPEK